jgi:glycosyltransferase involved in cell wall biosynthesis
MSPPSQNTQSGGQKNIRATRTTIALVMLSNFGRSDGGRETWAYNFIPGLLAARRDVHLMVYGFRYDGQPDNAAALREAVAAEDRARLTLIFLKAKRRWWPLFFSMARQLRAHTQRDPSPPPEFVIGIGALFEAFLVLICRRFSGSYRMLWLRGIFFDEKADKVPTPLLPIARRLETIALSRMDMLLAGGDDIAERDKPRGLAPIVIKNGVSIRRWAAAPPNMTPPIQVAYVGRLSKVKGISDFLELIKIIRESADKDSFEFHIAGEGPYLNDRVLALHESRELTYHGNIDNLALPEFLSKMDVCVALTYSSATLGGGGTSNALLEQMASGRVTLAWNNAIFGQLLNHKNAFLSEQHDVSGLADQLRHILSDKWAALIRAEQSKKDIAPYTVEGNVQRFLEMTKV